MPPSPTPRDGGISYFIKRGLAALSEIIERDFSPDRPLRSRLSPEDLYVSISSPMTITACSTEFRSETTTVNVVDEIVAFEYFKSQIEHRYRPQRSPLP